MRTSAIYAVAAWGSLVFVALTIGAMWVYPGGTFVDHASTGYDFLRNFFSDTGMTAAHNGLPNPVGRMLFTVATTVAGTGLVLFFAAFPEFFTRTPTSRRLAIAGTAFGIVAGVCFVGIAFTPADRLLDIHIQFVLWAFRTFPLAAFLFAAAIVVTGDYPRRYAAAFLGFGVLLVSYILLLEFGPSIRTPAGLLIQATGQKVIVYASIIVVMIQAIGARREAARRQASVQLQPET